MVCRHPTRTATSRCCRSIFYSMFGFRRVADLIWNAADSPGTRGFLLGATARHHPPARACGIGDGQSHLCGHHSDLPCLIVFGCEVAVIVGDGVRAMMVDNKRPSASRCLAKNCPGHAGGAGAHPIPICSARQAPDAKVLRWAAAASCARCTAAGRLRQDFGVARRRVERHQLRRTAQRQRGLRPLEPAASGRSAAHRRGDAATVIGRQGPVVAASDFAQLPRPGAQLGAQCISPYSGTDGFNRSDTRVALRDFLRDRRTLPSPLAAIRPGGRARCRPLPLDGLIESWASARDKPSPLA